MEEESNIDRILRRDLEEFLKNHVEQPAKLAPQTTEKLVDKVMDEILREAESLEGRSKYAFSQELQTETSLADYELEEGIRNLEDIYTRAQVYIAPEQMGSPSQELHESVYDDNKQYMPRS